MENYTISLKDLNINHGWYYPDYFSEEKGYYDILYTYHKKYTYLTLDEVQWLLWTGKDVNAQNILEGIKKTLAEIDEEGWFKYIIEVLSFLYDSKIIILEKRSYGIDAVIDARPNKIAVRIRAKDSKTNDIKMIQDVVSGAAMNGCCRIFIVGNLNYNSERLAYANGCCILGLYSDELSEICEYYESSIQNKPNKFFNTSKDMNLEEKLWKYIGKEEKNSNLVERLWTKRNKIVYKWWKRKMISMGNKVIEI